MTPGEAHALVSLLAAAVGIKVDISEAAAGAKGHRLRAGGSLRAATRRVCHTGALARPGVDAERPRSSCGAHASASPAGGVRGRPIWLICLAGGSLQAHVRPLCQLVITLPTIRSAGWSWSDSGADLGTVVSQ